MTDPGFFMMGTNMTMTHNTRFSVRNLLAWLLLLCVVLLGLSACVQVGEEKKAVTRKLVWPEPPDEPRFAYERTINGSDDVVGATEDSAMKLLLTGEKRQSIGFRKPYGVAVQHGRIFVSDTADHIVKVFDVPEGKFFTIGDDPSLTLKQRLVKPIGISVDGSGNLYAADATTKFVMVYDRDGKFLRKFGGPDFFDRLASVTVDKKSERAYVVDIGGAESMKHRIRVFNAQTGEHLFDIGKRGSGPGELNLPRSVAIGKDNKLYVVDGGNFRVQIFDAEGKFLKTFGQIGKLGGNFARPKEAAVDPDGNLYVIDAAFGNFQIFDPEGQLLLAVGERSDNKKPGGFSLPAGIAVDENGRVYVTDQLFKKVEIFRPIKLGEEEGFLVKKKTEESKK